MRKYGVVKWYIDSKGYGFITDEDGIDVFAHFSRILGDGYKTLAEGEKVSFNFDEQPKGPHALNIAKQDYKEELHPPVKLGARDSVAIRTRSLKVFLCHSKDDKLRVRELYKTLLNDGFDPWLDEEKLLPGQDWSLEIINAVKTTDVVAVCLSQNSISKTGYVQKEIKYALDVAQHQPEGAIFIIPAKLEHCSIPDILEQWHWVDMFEEHGYDRLKKALNKKAMDLSLTVSS